MTNENKAPSSLAGGAISEMASWSDGDWEMVFAHQPDLRDRMRAALTPRHEAPADDFETADTGQNRRLFFGAPAEGAGDGHASDCAIHNAPALPVGPCDCGSPFLAPNEILRAKELLQDADAEDNERFASWYGNPLLKVHEFALKVLAAQSARPNDMSASRAVDACGGTYSADEEASGYAAGHRAALDAAMKAVEPIDRLHALHALRARSSAPEARDD